MSRGVLVKTAFAFAAASLLAGWIAPHLKADLYRERIRIALEGALDRKVTMGEVRYNLFTGPGFTLTDVTIGEDPALGMEPIAYVGSMSAVPRILSLFAGRLSFSSLRLEDAHLNLSRVAVGSGYRWNFEALMRPALIAAFPQIRLKGARINFKAGDVKSNVYLLNSDLELSPPSRAAGPWQFRFEGQPARADRLARGSGSLRASGKWQPTHLDLNLELERSELGDVVALLRGEDVGVHGLISARARFQGPPKAVQVDGRMRVSEVHGWDQSVPKGGDWPLVLQGSWDMPAQNLALRASVEQGAGSKFAIDYTVEQYLTQPRWNVSLEMNRFSLEPLTPVARHLGVVLPAAFQLSGTLDGAFRYISVRNAWSGSAGLRDTRVAFPGSPPFSVPEARVNVAENTLRFEPAQVESAEGDHALISGQYSPASDRGEFRIAADGLDVGTLGQQTSLASVPILSRAQSGRWSGQLVYHAEPGLAPAWSGDVVLSGVLVMLAGLSDPIRIDAASGHLEHDVISLTRIRGSAGAIPFQGDYQYDPRAPRPHRFRLTAESFLLADLEKFFLPVLDRRNALLGLRIRLGRAPLPEWVRGLRSEGSLQVGEMMAGEVPFTAVRSRVLWDGSHISLTGLSGEVEGARIGGRAHIDLRNASPDYQLTTKLTGIAWKGGRLDADGQLLTSGTGSELLRHLRSSGRFAGKSFPDGVDSITGGFDFSWGAPEPHLDLTGVRVSTTDDLYTGAGGLQPDGTLVLQLTGGGRPVRVAGTLGSDGVLRWMP